MKRTLRGRPPLNLPLPQIEAVRRHRKVVAAARELGCSDAYSHVRLKEAALTLRRGHTTRPVDGPAQFVTANVVLVVSQLLPFW